MAMNPRLLRPRASGFDPRSISDLVLWLDAADESKVFLDVSGNVQEWRDKSANGYHATQTVAANRPAYSATLNGKKVVGFSGPPDSLTGTNPTQGTSQRTVLAVFSAEQGGSQVSETIVDLGNSSISDTGQSFSVTKEIAVRVLGGNAIFGSPVTLATIVTILSQTSNTTGISARRNGQPLTLVSSVSIGMNSGPTYSVGSGIGGLSTHALYGSAAEIIVYSRALLTAEIQAAESYLSGKWGIALT